MNLQPAIEAPKRILFIIVSRIGDTLLVTPAVRAIAAAYPQAEITLLGHPKRAEILRHLPFVARVETISKQRAPWLGRFTGKRYDLAFVCGNDRPLVDYALRVAERVIAFHQGDAALDARLFRSVAPPPARTEHAVHTQLLLPAAVGIAASGQQLAYVVSDDERRWAQEQLRRRLPAAACPLIGLQVASFPTKAYRDWPVERFLALCGRIVAEHPRTHFLIFGGSAERARTDAVAAQLGTRSTNFAGRLSLRQTAALMQQLDLYVGVDTGPTHIMGALHRPLVALYHGYSPSRILAPLDHPCCYVVDHPRPEAECSPQTPMAEIGVDRVWAAVARALAEHPPGQRHA